MENTPLKETFFTQEMQTLLVEKIIFYFLKKADLAKRNEKTVILLDSTIDIAIFRQIRTIHLGYTLHDADSLLSVKRTSISNTLLSDCMESYKKRGKQGLIFVLRWPVLEGGKPKDLFYTHFVHAPLERGQSLPGKSLFYIKSFYIKSDSEDDTKMNEYQERLAKVLKDNCIEHIEIAHRCHFCDDREFKNLKCSKCKSVRYCGSSCQKNDWKDHKLICKEKKV